MEIIDQTEIKKSEKDYSENELIDKIKKFYQKNSRIPHKSDFLNNSEYPSASTYQRRFGSWSKALEIAGFPNVTSARKIGQIIRNHTNTKCIICGSTETRLVRGRPAWFKYKIDKNGIFNSNGTWKDKLYLCGKCYDKENPESSSNKLKTLRKWRNKELSRDCTTGKGFVGQQIWCQTRSKLLGIEIKDCNIEMNNFNYPYDHSPDPEYGIVNVKYAVYKENNKLYTYRWYATSEDICDYYAVICMNKDETKVERIYVIPENVVHNLTGITITKKSSLYEKYRIDETPYNETYQRMNIKNCSVLKDDSEL